MSLSDAALDGSLTLSQLRNYLASNTKESLNVIGGKVDLTPLCAACLGGQLEVVKHLLSCGADPNRPSAHECTPLFYITDPQCKATSSTRCAIIRELVSGKSGLKADLNGPCDDDKNSPLMNVILELKDKAVIQQLVESGASTTVTHAPGQKTAKDLADEHGMARSLLSKAERDQAWGNLVDLVVSFVLLVVAYVNSTTLNKVVGGIAKKYYNISVKEADLPKDVPLKVVEPKSVDDFKNVLNDEVQKGKFGKFFAPNDPFLANLAEKASALREDTTTDLGKPENIKRLTQVSLYQPVIYCDDSGSMDYDNRYEYQIELVTRIARIATKIVPDDLAGVDLRFINDKFSKRLTSGEILAAMRSVRPTGGTNIGTNLRKKILQPLVYDIIATPNTASTPIPFRRPLLVCIITDGCPGPEAQNVLRDEIVYCKQKLEEKGYDPTSVMFCINQIGNSPEAEQFIDALRKEKEIEEVIYCTVGQLDNKFKELKEQERALESWLLRLLAKPILERHLD